MGILEAPRRPSPSHYQQLGTHGEDYPVPRACVSGVTGSMGTLRESVPSRPLPCGRLLYCASCVPTEDPPWTADGIPRLPGYPRLTGGLWSRARGCSPSLLGPARILCPAVSALVRNTGGLKAAQHPILYANSADTIFLPAMEELFLNPGSPRLVLTRALGPVCIMMDQNSKITHAEYERLTLFCRAHGQGSRVRELACCRTTLEPLDRFLLRDQLLGIASPLTARSSP